MLATTKKGNKPEFRQSASGVKAKTLYEHFFKQLQDQFGPDKVKNGIFAAMMDVALVNDGPVSSDSAYTMRHILDFFKACLTYINHTLTAHPGYYPN